MGGNTDGSPSEMMRAWSQIDVSHIVMIVVVAWLANVLVQRIVPSTVRRIWPQTRFLLLPWVPLLRLLILVAAVVGIAPLVVKPTPENLLALFGAGGLAIGFAFKDYLSCLLAGIVLLIERPYRVGDWVQIGDTFGEVARIDLRTVSIRTPDDNQVLIPHATIWTTPISNATSGQNELLCVTNFYLHPEHNGSTVCDTLRNVALTSVYLKPDRKILVVAAQRPFGLHYKIKAYPKDAREQFLFISDLTIRGHEALRQLGIQPITVPHSRDVSFEICGHDDRRRMAALGRPCFRTNGQ